MEILRGFMRSAKTCSYFIGGDPLRGSTQSRLLQRLFPLMQTELTSIRTNIRKHFRRPSEYKRVKRHGYDARMSTPSGRKILMRRILKGRHVLSH